MGSVSRGGDFYGEYEVGGRNLNEECQVSR